MQLSRTTRIAQSVLLREAVDDLLKKYQVAEGAAKSGWASGAKWCWRTTWHL